MSSETTRDERMAELVEFLRARLDEDKQEAKAVVDEYGTFATRWSVDEANAVTADDGGPVAAALRRFFAEHIARHDPARVLREVEAKRRIAALANWHAERNRHVRAEALTEIAGEAATEQALRRVLVLLALPYADHPDYREEWSMT